MQIDGEGQLRLHARHAPQVDLSPDGDGCEMHYHADMQVGGMIAGVGQRLLDSVSKQMARQSLEALSREIERRLAEDAPMKPAPFVYFAPRSLDEALALLADHGIRRQAARRRAEPRAGHELPPGAAGRARGPERRVAELAGIDGHRRRRRVDGRDDEAARRGAERAGRHARAAAGRGDAARSRTSRSGPAGPSAAAWRTPIRPPSCRRWPVALGATLHVRSARRPRASIPAADFFTGLFATALQAGRAARRGDVPAARCLVRGRPFSRCRAGTATSRWPASPRASRSTTAAPARRRASPS